MASSDTIVGVAGAVLLAGIMVAVFVYEYNNPPSELPLGEDEAARQAFASAYPLLDASEDIDGDGTPNYLDGDMDDDDVPDSQQGGTLAVRGRASGTTPEPPEMSHIQRIPLRLLTGNQGLEATLRWNVSVPDPLGTGQVPRLPNLSLRLVASDGGDLQGVEVTTSQSGSAVTVDLTADEQAVGNYTVEVFMQQATPSPEADYQVSWSIGYGPAQRRGVESDPR